MLVPTIRGTDISLIAGLSLFAQALATSTLPPPRPSSIRASGAQMLVLAGQLARGGQRTRADQILRLLSNDPDSDIRNEARFRLAALASADREFARAATLLRRILDEKPSAARVRLELAAVLSKLGDESAALRELRALRSGDLPPNVARFVDRLSATLQSSKPLGFHFELALAPDSNLNRATRSDSLGTVFGDFSIDEKVRSGLGAAARGLAQARFPIFTRVDLVARLTGDANIYRERKFNDILLDVAAGPEFRVGSVRITSEIGASRQWYGMEPYQHTIRLAGSIARPIDHVSRLRLDIAARRTDNKFNDLQDGRGMGVRARYERALSPKLMLSGSVGADRFKAEDAAYSTKTWSMALVAYRDIGRATVSTGVELGRLKADDRLILLPQSREDRLTRVQFGAVFRQLPIAGMAPMARLIIERNKSNIEFYDFKRTRAEVGISRAF